MDVNTSCLSENLAQQRPTLNIFSVVGLMLPSKASTRDSLLHTVTWCENGNFRALSRNNQRPACGVQVTPRHTNDSRINRFNRCLNFTWGLFRFKGSSTIFFRTRFLKVDC